MTGYLDQVPDLAADLSFDCIGNGSVTVRWIAPFTLDIFDNEYDIKYLLAINFNGANTVTVDRLTDLAYTVIVPDSTQRNASCTSVEILLTPTNLVGNGTSKAIITTPTEGSEFVMNMTSFFVVFNVFKHYGFGALTLPLPHLPCS